MIASFINSWLRDIVVLFIIVFIAELIMPKGNMKKYINLIIGLLIIIVIISPLARLMNYDFNIDNVMKNYVKTEELNPNIEDNFSKDQEKQIEKLFKEKLESQIIFLIEENWEYKVLNIDMEIENSKDNDNNIKLINIILKNENKNIQEKNMDNITVEKISKVEINRQGEKDASSINAEKLDEFNEIKKLISSSFSLDLNKIKINYEKER